MHGVGRPQLAAPRAGLDASVYEEAFQRSTVGSTLLSPTPDFTILAVNQAFLAAAGRASHELLGRPLFEVFPGQPGDGEDVAAAVRRSLLKVLTTLQRDVLPLQRYPIPVGHTGAGQQFEERYWSAVNTPLTDAQGRLVCIAHNTVDVTDLVRQKAEVDAAHAPKASARPGDEAGMLTHAQAMQAVNRAREAERHRLRLLFEHAPGFVYFTEGPQHVLVQGNGTFIEMVGQRDCLGQPMREAFPDLARQGLFEIHDQVLRTGKPYFLRGRSLHLDVSAPGGEPIDRVVDVVYQPITDADGRVTGICAQGNDITQRKRAEDELQEASRRKDEFLAMLAHELRNPLAPIAASAALLSRSGLDESEVRRTGEVISRQARHMTGLVDDLLDVSRVTRGVVMLERAPQDIRQIVHDAVEQVRPLVEARRHRLVVHPAAATAHVVGDHKRLVQVLTNLLNNAARYTPAGGQIDLRIEAGDGWVTLKVVDNGVGMTPELQPRVFDLFAQASRSADRAQGGLGLGLALVRSLVELHGGWVRCHSDGPDRGSCFTVSLPRMAEAVPAPGSVRPQASGQPEGRRVLVIDDNVDAAETLGLLLRAVGHEVCVEFSPETGLARARRQRPEVCLIDIGLPGMDGKEVARRLRASEPTRDAVLVAVTGYGQDADRQAALQAGFDRYLVKPVEMDTLLEALSQPRHASSVAPGMPA